MMGHSHKRTFQLSLAVPLVKLLLRGGSYVKELQDGGFILINVGSFIRSLYVRHELGLFGAITLEFHF